MMTRMMTRQRLLRRLVHHAAFVTHFLAVLMVWLAGSRPAWAFEDTYELKEPAGVADATGAARHVRFGAPLDPNANISDPIHVIVKAINPANGLYEEVPADVGVQTLRNGKIWWAKVDVPMNFSSANQEKTLKLLYDNSLTRATPPDPLTVTDTATTIAINTGAAQFVIKKAGFNVIDSATVNGEQIIVPNTTPGLEVESDAGVIYRSSNCPGAQSTASIQEWGPVHAIVLATGAVCNSSGTPFQDTLANTKLEYRMQLSFLRQSAEVEVVLDLTNAGPLPGYPYALACAVQTCTVTNYNGTFVSYGGHLRAKRVELVFVPAFGSPTDWKTWYTDTYIPTSYTTERYTVYQDHIPAQTDHEVLTAAAAPYATQTAAWASDVFRQFYVKVVNETAGTVPYYSIGLSQTQTGSRSKGLLTVRNWNRELSIGVHDFWEQSSKTLGVDGSTGLVTLGIRPNSSSPHLVHAHGPLANCPGGPTCTTYDPYLISGGSYAASNSVLPADVANHVFRSGTDERSRFALKFGAGSFNQAASLDFAKRVEAGPIIALPQPRSLFNTNKGFIDDAFFMPMEDWSSNPALSSDPLLVMGLNQWKGWTRAAWDVNEVTMSYAGSGWPIPKITMWLRLILGPIANGSWAPLFGPALWGAHPWSDGSHNTAYSDPVPAFLAVAADPVIAKSTEAMKKLWAVWDYAAGSAPYYWKNWYDAWAGAMKYEKGEPAYAFLYPSERHKTLAGQAAIALIAADEPMRRIVARSNVNNSYGYPFGGTPPTNFLPSIAASVEYDGFLKEARGLENLLQGGYQVTGDPQLVAIAIGKAHAMAELINVCYAQTGFPSVPQLNATSPTPTNAAQFICNYTKFPYGGNVSTTTQGFGMGWIFSGMIKALEAYRKTTGLDDPLVRDAIVRYVDFVNDNVLSLLPASGPVTSGSGPLTPTNTNYIPPSIYAQWFVIRPGVAVTPGMSLTAFGLSNYCGWALPPAVVGAVVPLSNASGPTGYHLMFSTCPANYANNFVLAETWTFVWQETNDPMYLATARRYALDMILFLGGNPYGVNLSNPAALNAALSKKTYRHDGLGLADTKMIMPMLVRMLRYFRAATGQLGAVGPPPPLDPIPPTVSLTAPSNNATLFGTIPISATATDNVGVVGVQFLMDGQSLSEEDLVAPYTVTWNAATVSSGPHVLSARARDAAGNYGYAANVSVTVGSNTIASVFGSPSPDCTGGLPHIGAIGTAQQGTTFKIIVTKGPSSGTGYFYIGAGSIPTGAAMPGGITGYVNLAMPWFAHPISTDQDGYGEYMYTVPIGSVFTGSTFYGQVVLQNAGCNTGHPNLDDLYSATDAIHVTFQP